MPTVPAAALPWLAPYAGIFLLAWRRPLMTAVGPASGSRVSIIVPARNEAPNIAALLDTLRGTDYPPWNYSRLSRRRC